MKFGKKLQSCKGEVKECSEIKGPKMKYYSLIEWVYSKANLDQAYKAVRAYKSAPGEDGEGVYAFGKNLEAELEELHLGLKTSTYKPMPVRRVGIPKPEGSKRPFGVPQLGIKWYNRR